MKTSGVDVRHVFEPTGDHAFVFRDGSRAESLAEFHERIAHAPADMIDYHREHFAPWIRDVIADPPLARRLEDYARMRPHPETLRETLLDLVAQRLDHWKRASPQR